MRFQDRVAVITGAGSGIGEATAYRLAAEGARVVLVGRTKPKLDKVSQSINAREGGQCAFTFQADVTNESQVKELVSFLKDNFDRFDVLVNNAGSTINSTILETTVEQWKQIQDDNLNSVFLVSKYLGQLMIEQHTNASRSIVNIASLSGHKAGSQIPHYSSAKAGVINFTRALALELSPYAIRVNSISPGFVETPLTEQGLANEQFLHAIKRNTALRRVGRPEEIANVISFVASEEASYMTGSDILVDGGWLIK